MTNGSDGNGSNKKRLARILILVGQAWGLVSGIRRLGYVIALLIALSLGVILGDRNSAPISERRQDGMILVDSPEVYSRERLLNDRLRQHRWLDQRLKDSDQIKFRSQATVERGVETKSGATAELTNKSTAESVAPPKKGGKPIAKEAGTSVPSDTRVTNGANSANSDTPGGSPIDKFREHLAYREEIRAELLETQLDDRHDIKGNTLYRLKFDSTILPEKGNGDWAFIEVKLSKADSEYDMVETYDRWVHETQVRLNDYLSELTQSFFTRTTKSDELLEFEKFMRRRIGRSNEEDTPTSSPNDEKLSSNNPFWFCQLKEVSRRVDCLDIFFDRIINTPSYDQIFGTFEPAVGPGPDPNFDLIRAVVRNYMSYVYGGSNSADDQRRSNSQYSIWKVMLDEASGAILRASDNLELLKAMGKPMPHDVPDPEIGDPFPQVRKAIGKTAAAFELERQVIRSAFADFVVEKYGFGHNLDRFADIQKIGCGAGRCKISMRPKTEPDTTKSAALCVRRYRVIPSTSSQHDTAETNRWACPNLKIVEAFYGTLEPAPVYSYTVHPKESIQRVMETFSHVRELKLALRASANGPSLARLDGILDHLRREQQRVQTIRRQPLIVGFSDRDIAKDRSIDNNGEHEGRHRKTHFGWLIGPKFAIGDRQGSAVDRLLRWVGLGGPAARVAFRHVPIQNALAAVVSVPSWWRTAQIDILACFISPERTTSIQQGGVDPISVCSRDKEEASHETRRHKRRFDFKIRLPGRTIEIPRKMGYTVGRSPRLTSLESLGELYVGQKDAELLLIGVDLWRSTVVTVGSQKADKIVILPDMKGIIATFDEVKAPLRWGKLELGLDGVPRRGKLCMADLDILVWTSEGRTDPQKVTIYQRKEDFDRGRCASDNRPEALTHLKVGTKKAALIIEGGNLKKVTHVMMGNQVTDKMTVLGGRGIMATFDEIKRPRDWPKHQHWLRVPIIVWDSERTWLPGFACLYLSRVDLGDRAVRRCPPHGPQSDSPTAAHNSIDQQKNPKRR